MLMQCPLKVLIQLLHAFTETDFRLVVKAVSVPTLVVHGDHDTSAPIDLTGRRTANLIRNCRSKVYEGAAHGLPVTHQDRLNVDLIEFVPQLRRTVQATAAGDLWKNFDLTSDPRF